MRGKLDIVKLQNVDGNTIELFPLTQLEEVQDIATAMSQYHNDRFIVTVKNVEADLYPHLAGHLKKDLSKYQLIK